MSKEKVENTFRKNVQLKTTEKHYKEESYEETRDGLRLLHSRVLAIMARKNV